MLNAIKPEHLRVAHLFRLLLADERGCVVAAGFGKAHPTLDCADIFVLHTDFDRVQPRRIIGTDGRKDDDKFIRFGRMYAEEGVGGDDKRTDIQRCAFFCRHPVDVCAYQLDDGLQSVVRVDLRDAETAVGVVHPLDVFLRTEQ